MMTESFLLYLVYYYSQIESFLFTMMTELLFFISYLLLRSNFVFHILFHMMTELHLNILFTKTSEYNVFTHFHLVLLLSICMCKQSEYYRHLREVHRFKGYQIYNTPLGKGSGRMWIRKMNPHKRVVRMNQTGGGSLPSHPPTYLTVCTHCTQLFDMIMGMES